MLFTASETNNDFKRYGEYAFWCIDCIIDEGCYWRWETDGGK